VADEREQNTQAAPWPGDLEVLVAQLSYRPGWRFSLQHEDRGQGSEGLTFTVVSLGYDTHHVDRGETYRVAHYFPVPPAAYNRQSWARWLLDRLIEVETHECCEYFRVAGLQPFAPNHGPGWDPYGVRELNSAEHAETTFRGERRSASQAAAPLVP
jgi:hypothetical protein